MELTKLNLFYFVVCITIFISFCLIIFNVLKTKIKSNHKK